MKELIGHTIKEIWVNEDQSILKFVTDQGELCYNAVGDCCSESWFADILFSYNFFKDSKVESVEEIQIPDFIDKLANKDGRTRQEYDQVYGFKITLEKSSSYRYGPGESCDIIFRNSSNGYYGGWCESMKLDNKWNKEKYDESDWSQITEDWRA